MRALKICLWIGAVLCLVSVFGAFLPISTWESVAAFFGVDLSPFPETPLCEYAIRVASATYVAAGVYLIILARQPIKYPVLIPFTAMASMLIGMVCGLTGLIVKMPPVWYLGDCIGCLLFGILILFFWKKAKVH